MGAVNDVLNSLKGIYFFYIPNPGNAGDSLIACATYQVFDQLGLNYKILDINLIEVDLSDKVVVLGGGGNFIGIYPNVNNFLVKYHSVCRQIILLPHTIRDRDDTIESFGDNVVLICREQISYDYVSALNTRAKVYLDDDMALCLDPDYVFSSFKGYSSELFKLFFRNLKRRVKIFMFKRKSSSKTLHAFRTDPEKLIGSSFGSRDSVNFDVSQVFAADSMNKLESIDTIFRIIKFLMNFDIIYTDRLHVCILSAILKKNVVFYPNSYDKNHSVYIYSLRDRFPNIKFFEESSYVKV